MLFCDTTGDRESFLALVTAQGRIRRSVRVPRSERHGDRLFQQFRKLCAKERPRGIIVVVGPGRFSGIRHGVTLANTLAFSWGIPVAGVKKGERDNAATVIQKGLRALSRKPKAAVFPEYGKNPSITL